MVKRLKELIEDTIKKYEVNSDKKGITGVQSGFKRLDELTYGWQPGNLIIIAGRPGMGTFAFVKSMIRNTAVDYNKAVALFSLAMSTDNLISQMILSETGIRPNNLRRGRFQTHEWEILNNDLDNLSNAPIYIDDTPSLSISDLKIRASKLVEEENVKLIVINNLQLMTIKSSSTISRKEEINTISRNLKNLAKELNIPIIALSELTNTVETRGGSKRPLLSDLRELGTIEQNADLVAFIYRPEYYGMKEWDDEDGTPCEGQGDIIVSKNRNGMLNNIRMKFYAHLAMYSDLRL